MNNKVKNINIKTAHTTFLMKLSIRYVTIKDLKYVKINSVSPLYLIFNKVNGYFEEINGNKNLTPVPTNENKEKIRKI